MLFLMELASYEEGINLMKDRVARLYFSLQIKPRPRYDLENNANDLFTLLVRTYMKEMEKINNNKKKTSSSNQRLQI